MRRPSVIALLVVLLAATACSGDEPTPNSESPRASPASPLPQGDDPVELDPADFVDRIDHPFWPMTPGNNWVYEEGGQRIVVTVTQDTREIEGITATVVHDVVTQGGELIEDTFDWYAQDVSGNLWYLGEDTKEYQGGEVVGTEGSWEHGLDGALAGVLLPGDPQVGLEYRQEYYEGEAEDNGKILSLDEHVEVPFGSYEGCLQTEDTTALEPDVIENKYYCEGVGPVLAVQLAPEEGREELVEHVTGDPAL